MLGHKIREYENCIQLLRLFGDQEFKIKRVNMLTVALKAIPPRAGS